jgi:hypothetical protein
VAVPPSVAAPPPHGSEQVEPAAHVCVRPPLHLTVHAVLPPHTIVHPELPAQSPVQPPFGQLIVQLLLPVHATVEPVSTVTSHVLPPPHVTVLLVPVDTVQLLVPSQVVVQFELQLPTQVDWPSHVVVHPVPHVELHSFFESQLYVTPFGALPASASTPPSPPSAVALIAPPKLHLPPALQVHVLPVHVQSPVHSAFEPTSTALLPPQLRGMAIPIITMSSEPNVNEAPD